MDVARRRECADIADLISLWPDQVEVGCRPAPHARHLDDTEPAPGDVIENPGDL
jgi:hypothetical protein